MSAQVCNTVFKRVEASLSELVGSEYIDAVCRASHYLTGEDAGELKALAATPVDFFPESMAEQLRAKLGDVGTQVCEGLAASAKGATSAKFREATSAGSCPIGGFGYYRLGEDGRLRMISKSEHYHAPLGHRFPGYGLVETARRIGITNATHNNTRGHITRLLEEELVRTSGGRIGAVLNLETGSLAVEGALKMILARFYQPEPGCPAPTYAGRTPVFMTIGANDGSMQANYHGTTALTQTMRGMWPDFYAKLADAGAFVVKTVRPNKIEDVKAILDEYDTGDTKVAGFFHEICMMNYGGLLLTPEFLQEAYKLCQAHDVATVDDEIQSCMWHHDLYMFREWGLAPDFVAIGKGFPGGEYAASRLLFNPEYDALPQFGALVTNGQEELASLTYLVTMKWAAVNAEVTRAIGDYFEKQCRALAEKYPQVIAGVEGKRHLGAIEFREVDAAVAFAKRVSNAGYDISVHTYKAACPPVALLKMPLIADGAAVDAVINAMDKALQ